MKYEHSLVLRILFCFIPLQLYYIIFTPLTVYGSYLLLSFYNPNVIGDTLFINKWTFDIVSACVAGFAYFFLLVLVLLTKDIKFLNKIKMILLGFALIYLFNIIRIAVLILISINLGFGVFDKIHMIFWNLFSGAYVALVWIFLVLIFKIKSIPIYDDIKYLFKKSSFKK